MAFKRVVYESLGSRDDLGAKLNQETSRDLKKTMRRICSSKSKEVNVATRSQCDRGSEADWDQDGLKINEPNVLDVCEEDGIEKGPKVGEGQVFMENLRSRAGQKWERWERKDGNGGRVLLREN
jgi:hypothetical protein